MSDSDHIVIDGEAVTLDPAQVDYCSSQDSQGTVVLENVPPDVAAEVIYLWHLGEIKFDISYR